MFPRRISRLRLPPTSSLPHLHPNSRRPYSATIRSAKPPTEETPTLTQKTPEEKLAPLTQFNILQPPPNARLFTSVTNTGFQLSDIAIDGPAMVLGGRVFMWDVPQYGVGGVGDLEAEIKEGGVERCTDQSSPFYGWGTDMFKLLEVVVPAPGMRFLCLFSEFVRPL